MKTLDQVEARTPLVPGAAGVIFDADGGINISQSGSYYLTRPLDYAGALYAIKIQSDRVTLDFNGFTVRSTGASAEAAVEANSVKDICITNGFILGGTTESGGVFTAGGFLKGIYCTGTASTGLRVCDLTVRGIAAPSGTAAIYLPVSAGKTSLVERCVVEISAGIGIRAATVLHCMATRCGSTGIEAHTVSDSEGRSVGSGVGIIADTVTNSTGVSVSGYGLVSGWNAYNCLGTSVSGIGLSAINATNCTGTSTSGSEGMKVTGTASFCRGSRQNGTALSAAIAIGCTAGSGNIVSPQKHLGTP